MYKYSKKNAKAYNQLGIAGTTYEPGFNEVSRVLGDLSGKIALDFGSGTGRTSQMLLGLGANKVIGVDCDESMINQAKRLKDDRLEFTLIEDKIPLGDNKIDVALCTHVFIEMDSLDKMERVSREISRVLKPGGVFIIVTNNPEAIGHEFVSYGYKKKDNLKSGDKIICTMKTKNAFEIDDYFWTENDYKRVLIKTGFTIKSINYPKASKGKWFEETKVAPHLVIECIK